MPRLPIPARKHEGGFVLIVVITVIGLLALAAAGFAQVTRSQVKTAASSVGSSTAQALADAGVELAILELVQARQDPSYQRRFALGGKPFLCDDGNGRRLAVSVSDEAGKVDLNTASDRLLQALLAGVGAPASQALADAIMDYRDDDNTRRPQGAERDQYTTAGRAGPKNALFSVVAALAQVLGVDADLAARLRPHITVYTGQPGIDTTSASQELLAILARGLGQDPAPAASDSQQDQTSEERSRLPFMGAQGRRFFALHAEAVTEAGAFVRDAVVELGQSRARPYTFLRWHRGVLRGGDAALSDTALSPCP
jgi:general secretion pathway protein K